MSQLMNLSKFVDEFHDTFMHKMEHLESKHRRELFHLHNIKRNYKAMVAVEGKENVDRRLMISQIQARRRAHARGNTLFDTREFQRVDDNRERGRPGYYSRFKIDDTMLY